MRVYVIDTRNMVPELQGGLIGIVGSTQPTAEEKRECVDTVSRYAVDGWAIAADPKTPIGRLAALTAETACVPFITLNPATRPGDETGVVTGPASPHRQPAPGPS